MRQHMVAMAVACSVLFQAQVFAGESGVIPFPNGSFDEGEASWFFSRERGLQTRATAEYTRTPPGALRFYADTEKKIGARVDSPLVAVKGPGNVDLRFQVCRFSGNLICMYIKQYDANRKILPGEYMEEIGGSYGKWEPVMSQIMLDEKTAYLQFSFRPYMRPGEIIDMFLDDFTLTRVPMPIPPWPSQYKLKPGDKDKLTAADVVGPDGLVYPDWTQVGVQGGIPDVPVAVDLAGLGVKTGTDISDVLGKACRDAAAKGGGAVLIGPGTYYLDRPVVIEDSGVVIRGSGRDQTRLVFRYPVGVPGTDVGLHWPLEGGTVGPDTMVSAFAYHVGIKGMSMSVNDKALPKRDLAGYNGLQIPGSEFIALAGTGPAVVRVEAEYLDGRKVTAERKVVLTQEPQPVKTGVPMTAALFLSGRGLEEKEHSLSEDGKRGDTELVLKDAADIKVGDRIELHAPGTPRWQEIIQHRLGGDDWKRIGFFEVRARNGNRLTINQPLRIDYPVIDGAHIRKVKFIERSGVEHLTIEHTSRLSVHSIMFDWGWNGWIRNVKVVKSGANGAYAERSKWIEIRDCELDQSWNFDGGQAYAGFTSCHDSLFENCTVRKYRHGPVVQYGAMGNVFRNCTFDGSDIQWHAGWSTENLFENCTVRSDPATGSYGYGAYATGSADTGHGPNGPRNVVYGCDVTSPLNGVLLCGVNEGWLFLNNRFVVEKGAGFVVMNGCFDHTVRDNVFVLRDGTSPMVLLKTEDCVGIDLIGNTVVGGNGKIWEGRTKPELEKGNKSLPAGQMPERIQPKVQSIYEWQKKR